jgi:F-type H+-transporting ATPase subunit epsilon
MADDSHKLKAEVLTPEGKVFEGELFQVSARTVVGEIGVRARHAPMLARLVASELRLYGERSDFDSADGGDRYAAAEGWLEVFANKVVILVEEAIEPGDLDTADLKERISDAEQRLSEADEDSTAAEVAQRDKDRAEAFLEIAGS